MRRSPRTVRGLQRSAQATMLSTEAAGHALPGNSTRAACAHSLVGLVASDPVPSSGGAPATRSRRERLRLYGSFVLGALAVLFAVLNLDDVQVNWIIATWDTPLIVVIALSVLVGAAIGWFVSSRRGG